MKKEGDSINLREGNIGLILDSYNDLFSDFDPRPYSEKILSDDFLQECKRAARDKEEDLELKLFIPKEKRNYSNENLIKHRLKIHFNKTFRDKHKEIKKIKREGIIWFFIGSFIMLGATFLLNFSGFFFKFLLILAEPAGWFTFWEGLGKVFIDSKTKKPEYSFYKKMASSKISFVSY